MNLAALAGSVDAYENTANIYREAAAASGHDPEELPITLSGFLFTGETTQEAVQEAYPYVNNGMTLVFNDNFL